MITDYDPFLRIAEDGRIWWIRKDAIHLRAAFFLFVMIRR
jgi:hypothetical protein